MRARPKMSEQSSSLANLEKLFFKKLSGLSVPLHMSERATASPISISLGSLVRTSRYMQSNWYYHNDALVHNVKNLSAEKTLLIETFECLPY